MPVTTQPNLIEVSDFSKGAMPDLEPVAVPGDGLIGVLNLLPDAGTGTLQLRKGFKRRFASPVVAGYTIQTMTPYAFINASKVRKNYLILVMQKDGTSDNVSDNIRVYAYDFDADTVTWISNAGVAMTWVLKDARHWGETINGVFYGGGPGDEMYSWDGTTWDSTAATHDFKTMVAPSAGIDLTTQVSSDKSFRGRDKVKWSDADNPTVQSYKSRNHNWPKKWKTAEDYGRGDKVRIRRAWFVGKSWNRSFRCKKDHTADATNRPGDGTGAWTTYWRPIISDDPRDEEGTISDDWVFMPRAAITNIAAWNSSAHRLFLRYDDLTAAGPTRVQFSAAAKEEDTDEITTIMWSPFHFGRKDSKDSTGGGSLPDLGGTEQITAMFSFGVYFFVFTRNTTWVLHGGAEDSWNFHKIADVGCVNMRAVCAMDGLVYFVGPQGLSVSDGTIVGEVKNSENVQDYISSRVDVTSGQVLPNVTLWAYDEKVWMCIPSTAGGAPAETVVLDVRTKSFWLTDLAVMDACTFRRGGKDYVFFAMPSDNVIMQYDHPDVQATPTDDTSADAYASTTIAWNMQTGWFSFGTLREERRIRRVWALIRNIAATATLNFYRNYSTSADALSSTRASSATAGHVEGKWLADCYAVSLKLSGTGNVEVLGVALDTQPRRFRYHANV